METDYIPNNQLEIPDEVPDFGTLLRSLRNNHGYTVPRLSKLISLPPKQIYDIELGKSDLPPENILRLWLHKLGCGRSNVEKIILLARQHRIRHWFSLHRNDRCNPDILRLIKVYTEEKLTEYDKDLLRLVARQ